MNAIVRESLESIQTSLSKWNFEVITFKDVDLYSALRDYRVKMKYDLPSAYSCLIMFIVSSSRVVKEEQDIIRDVLHHRHLKEKHELTLDAYDRPHQIPHIVIRVSRSPDKSKISFFFI